MASPALKRQIGSAIAALQDHGERVHGVILRPGGEVVILTDQLITTPISGEALDDELAAFKAEHGYN